MKSIILVIVPFKSSTVFIRLSPYQMGSLSFALRIRFLVQPVQTAPCKSRFL